MNAEEWISLLMWLCYFGWAGAIIFGIGYLKNEKTINEFYKYAKKLEEIIRQHEEGGGQSER